MIFKEGDRVFDAQFGWGVIRETEKMDPYPMFVEFEHGIEEYKSDGTFICHSKVRNLSFTEYDYIKGGFSQERPRPDIKKGQLVYVKDKHMANWEMRIFSHWSSQFNKVICFKRQDCSGREFSMWDIYSLTNPLEDE